MELGLHGKTALVVASSQGIGKAIAKQFVLEGTNVMLASRNVEQLKMVQAELEKLNGGNVHYVACDITNPEDIKEMVKSTVEIFGTIDIVINNAGGPPTGGFEDMDDDNWQYAFELNLLSYIRIIREALPYLKIKGGRIINIASSSIREPIPNLILSNTFRMGIVGLSKSIADEYGEHNILINTVAPGRILTDRLKEIDEMTAATHGVDREIITMKAQKSIPLGRDGSPEEFANVVVFLASEANTYMTGSSFFVDGGRLRSV